MQVCMPALLLALLISLIVLRGRVSVYRRGAILPFACEQKLRSADNEISLCLCMVLCPRVCGNRLEHGCNMLYGKEYEKGNLGVFWSPLQQPLGGDLLERPLE